MMLNSFSSSSLSSSLSSKLILDPQELTNNDFILFLAVANSDPESVRNLLKSEGLLNKLNELKFVRDESGIYQQLTVLHFACRNNELEIVKVLVFSGANVNSRANQGVSPLHLAVCYGSKEMVVFLLKHKAKINAQGGPYNHTALTGAAEIGNLEMVKLLVDHGADITLAALRNFWSSTRETPLEIARMKDHRSVVTFLEEVRMLGR